MRERIRSNHGYRKSLSGGQRKILDLIADEEADAHALQQVLVIVWLNSAAYCGAVSPKTLTWLLPSYETKVIK